MDSKVKDLIQETERDRGAWRRLYTHVNEHPEDYTYLVPFLNSALNDLEDRDHAAYILASIGPSARAAIPNLIQALTYDPVNYVCQPYVEALTAIAQGEAAVVDALVSVLDWLTSDEICLVAELLLRFDIASPKVIEALKKIPSYDPDEAMQKRASEAIARFEQLPK